MIPMVDGLSGAGEQHAPKAGVIDISRHRRSFEDLLLLVSD
jgi:hypothetical protein